MADIETEFLFEVSVDLEEPQVVGAAPLTATGASTT